MLRVLLCLLLALQSASSSLPTPESRVTFAMRTGILLRMHVVAQDDTEEMQRIKLVVRDAVRESYDERYASPCLSMLAAAETMLPELTAAAVDAARKEGFDQAVTVTIETLAFDERELDGYILPAGEYPALMIRLGGAQGHNWWGLIDPELSLRAAALPGWQESSAIEWDWSLRAFFSALLGLPLTAEEGDDA